MEIKARRTMPIGLVRRPRARHPEWADTALCRSAMIVSHQHRLIFIKTQKTAGTSIEVMLSTVCGPNDTVTPIVPHVPPHRPRNHKGFFNHMTAEHVRCLVDPEHWRSYTKFCVERNPWDKALSHFFMLKNSLSHGKRSDLTLDRYLAEGHEVLNWPQYMDPAGQTVIVDRVLRYERLDEELGEVLTSCGISYPGHLTVRAKAGYRTDRRPYREIFTPAQADLVARAYAKEIALHGYEF
jgi:hypothetical protein